MQLEIATAKRGFVQVEGRSKGQYRIVLLREQYLEGQRKFTDEAPMTTIIALQVGLINVCGAQVYLWAQSDRLRQR